MQKYQDVVLNQNGNPVSGVQVTVTDLLGTPVSVYSANAIGLNVNPLTSDNNGRFSFYAPDGRYNLSFSFGGNVVASITDILLEDTMDGSDAVFNDVTILGELSDASKVTSAPVGGLTATNVQAALAELDSEKIDASSLAAPGGSALVGSDDGASGSLWTTVAGFIAFLLSSLGASVIGFIQAGTGAIQRSVHDKLRETVSVKDFGAVGDGVADDTAAIIAALASSAKRIHFPAGTYELRQAASVIGGTVICGDGQELTTIKCRADIAGDVAFLTLASSATIESITIQGTSTSSGTGLLWSGGVYVVGQNGKMLDVSVKTFKVGVDINSWFQFSMDRCRIYSNGKGFNATPLTNGGDNGYINGVYVTDSYFWNNGTHDVYFSPAVRISNAHFQNTVFDPGATTYQIYIENANPIYFTNCYWETAVATRSIYGKQSNIYVSGGYGLGTGIECSANTAVLSIENLRTTSTFVVVAGNALHTVNIENTALPASGNSLPPGNTKYLQNSSINGTSYGYLAPTLTAGPGDSVYDWKGWTKSITATINANTTAALISNQLISSNYWSQGAVGYATISDSYNPGLILTVTCATTAGNNYFCVLATNTTGSAITLTSKTLNVIIQRMNSFTTL